MTPASVPINFGSLFAGVGGFDLGFERAGMTPSWQVEIDGYCQKVLAKHWPSVRRHGDIKTFPETDPAEWSVDVVCGGFPCQDISNAGKRVGIGGGRSGLWSEFARVLRVVRPRAVVVENVDALPVRGLPRVLGDLADLGFDAEWQMLSACAFGFPHTRKRLFIMGYTDGLKQRFSGRVECEGGGEAERDMDFWPGQPEPSRVADGVPRRVDRNSRLGNAVVPQVAEWVGRRVVAVLTKAYPRSQA